MPTKTKRVKIDDIVKKGKESAEIIIKEDKGLLAAGLAAGATLAATALGVGIWMFKKHKKKHVDLKKVMKDMKHASDKVTEHVHKMTRF